MLEIAAKALSLIAIVGIGETHYYKHGQSPDAEFKLALQAVLRACADAGLEALAVPGGVTAGTEEVGSHVVVDPGDLEAEAVEDGDEADGSRPADERARRSAR